MKSFLIIILSTVFVSSVFAAEPSAPAKNKKAKPEAVVAPVSPAPPVYVPVEPVQEEAHHNVQEREDWQWRAVVGLDFQVANSKINPQGSYEDPESETEIGGAGGFLVRHYFTPKFAMSTGGELVYRQLTQDYTWWLWTSSGETSYQVLSFEIPIYFELVLGSGKHSLYAGPRLATPVTQHCSAKSDNSVSIYPCVKDAASSLFVPIQIGYNLRLGNVFGLNFFIEQTATPVIDKDAIEAHQFRTGALATFYF